MIRSCRRAPSSQTKSGNGIQAARVPLLLLFLLVAVGCDSSGTLGSSERPITAGEVSAGDVDAGDVLAGDVDAGAVTAGAVTAGNVTAGTVTAGEIYAGDVVIPSITIGAAAPGTVTILDVEPSSDPAGAWGTAVATQCPGMLGVYSVHLTSSTTTAGEYGFLAVVDCP